MSIRISDLLMGLNVPDGVTPAKPLQFEQTEEYRRMMQRARECRPLPSS